MPTHITTEEFDITVADVTTNSRHRIISWIGYGTVTTPSGGEIDAGTGNHGLRESFCDPKTGELFYVDYSDKINEHFNS